jgi:hypothetical protein
MEDIVIQEITRTLAQFAGAKFATQVLAVKGPVQDGSNYRWRLVSKPYNEVTVLVSTRKPQFGRTSLSSIAVHGLQTTRPLRPDLGDLQEFLRTAELAAAG